MDSTQPGTVITPGGSTTPPTLPPTGAPAPERPAETPAEPAPAPAPTSPQQAVPVQPTTPMPSTTAIISEPVATAAVPIPSPAQAEPVQGGWFHQDTNADQSGGGVSDESVSWTAPEFIERPKNAAWYSLFALGAFAIVVFIYIFTKDKLSTGIVALCLAAVGIYSARKPREQQYVLGRHGIQVGARTYNFGDFRTFSVADEGSIASVVLMPLRRFMLPLTLALDPQVEDAVVDYLAARLPFEQHKPDVIEGLLQRIRF